MSVGSVDIVNRALTKLGDVTIRSFNDNTTASRLAASSYDLIRRAELRLNYWNFSLVRTTLTYLTDVSGNPIKPAWNYGLTYQLPSDCLRVYQVNDIFNGVSLAEYRNQDVREFVIEGDKLLTNMTGNNFAGGNFVSVPGSPSPVPLPILYVSDAQDPNKFDAMFIEALACKLAMEWAERLTQSAPKRQLATQEYVSAIRQARSIGSCETPAQPLPDNTWVLSRVS
jgi:hypothetical protein